MPELPEVETIRRQLEPRLMGRRLVDAWAFDSPKFTDARRAVGSTVESLGRRGKYLIAGLGDHRLLVVHLGMTGSLRVSSPADEPAPTEHLRAWWLLDDGATLLFRDIRRFGRIAVLRDDRLDPLPTLAALGPEPFDEALTAPAFRRGLNAGRRHLKTKLLDQRLVAGVGNIYADEAFFAAGVHPADRRITMARADRLLTAVRDALTAGVRHGGTTLRDYVDSNGAQGSHQLELRCYGRSGLPCTRCGAVLRKSVIDARTSTWCPTCQPRR